MRKPEFAERNLQGFWDSLTDIEQIVICHKYPDFKPPGKRPPPNLESTEEVEKLMRNNKDVKR